MVYMEGFPRPLNPQSHPMHPHVGMFHIENNKFTGTLHRRMGFFQYMKEVGIAGNKFTGRVTECNSPRDRSKDRQI